MDAFSFRDQVIRDYEQFARSFTNPKAEDIRSYLDAEYGTGRYWPSPLIQVNPFFVAGQNVEQLVASRILHPSVPIYSASARKAENREYRPARISTSRKPSAAARLGRVCSNHRYRLR